MQDQPTSVKLSYKHADYREWHSFKNTAEVKLKGDALILEQKADPTNRIELTLPSRVLERLEGCHFVVQSGRLGLGASEEYREYTNKDFDVVLRFEEDDNGDVLNIRLDAEKWPPFYAQVGVVPSDPVEEAPEDVGASADAVTSVEALSSPPSPKRQKTTDASSTDEEKVLSSAAGAEDAQKKEEHFRKLTIQQRVKHLKGKQGLEALKWARDRASDHVVHLEGGDQKLFDKYLISSLARLDDEQLVEAIDFYQLALEQYLAFSNGSTSRS